MPLAVKFPRRGARHGRAPWRVRLVCAAISWLAPTLAGAHPETSPALVNRYVTLAAHVSRLEASVALLYGHLPAAALRREADLDGDGALAAPEAEALRKTLAAQAGNWLRLRIDGAPAEFAPELTVDLGPDRGTRPAPLVVEARMPLAHAARLIEVELAPGPAPARHGETEVSLALGSGWALERSQGPLGSSQRRTYKVEGNPPPPLSVAFVLTPAKGEGPRAPGLWAVAIVLPAAAALALWTWRRRRQRSGMG